MCGIAGLIHLENAPADPSVLKAMTRFLRHRGPDDEGVWVKGPVALGHQRLSIIDLSEKGRNPMANDTASLRIVYSGEVYNFLELRQDLAARGYRFRSGTDTEVVLKLYEAFGETAVEKLNGMFAFAIWDEARKRLFLARDRFGIKPLYYTQQNGVFAFASEMKAFLALPGFRAEPDRISLSDHLTFQNTFGDRTFFRGVKILPPGHTLIYEEGSVTLRRYWDLCFEPDEKVTEEEWCAGIREHFETAVRRQLVSDVPVGSFLSGGMDTGSIVSVAVRTLPEMHTFTCGFDLPQAPSELEKYFDETQESEALAKLFKTQHHAFRLQASSMERVLPQVVWHLDEPRVGISYPVYYTSLEIARHVKVVLSGVGGDELFAGYPWRYQAILETRPAEFQRRYYQNWVRLLSDEEKNDLFTPETRQALGDYSSYDSFRAVYQSASVDFKDPLHAALYFDLKTFLHGLLVVDDKLNMAHSVESRVPFLDHEFVDYVRRIPSRFKFSGSEGKAILRKAMRGLVPDPTLRRRKQGFTPPDGSWYKNESLGYLRGILLSPRALARGYFQPSGIKKILEDHENGKRNHRFLIWSLLCFEWWSHFFVDGERLSG